MVFSASQHLDELIRPRHSSPLLPVELRPSATVSGPRWALIHATGLTARVIWRRAIPPGVMNYGSSIHSISLRLETQNGPGKS
jgi:hypothetical protein